MAIARRSAVERALTNEEVNDVLVSGLVPRISSGERALFVVPDNTRSFPKGFLTTLLKSCPASVSRDVLLALGTHKEMTDEEILNYFGIGSFSDLPGVRFFNHDPRPEALVQIGEIGRSQLRQIAEGQLSDSYLATLPELTPVTINKRIFDYDHVVIVGPVFPHEVVGISGGGKYFFPGVSGESVINTSHWLGALMGIKQVIGITDTPVRRMIELACSFVEKRVRVSTVNLVLGGAGFQGLFIGGLIDAHRAAAEFTRQLNIRWCERPYHTVFAVCPIKYYEMWLAGKLAYKHEPVIAKGGRLIIYAPHIKSVADHHPDVVRAGYHGMNYFVSQWEKLSSYELSSLAHSTHVYGECEWDGAVETPYAQRVLLQGFRRMFAGRSMSVISNRLRNL